MANIFRKLLKDVVEETIKETVDPLAHFEEEDDIDEEEYEELYEYQKQLAINEDSGYFKDHPEDIPSCCNACGGPYPLCRWSCKVFDD